MGAGLVVTVNPVEEGLQKAKTMGEDALLDPTKRDLVEEVMKLTQGVERTSTPNVAAGDRTIRRCVNVARPGGTISSVGINSKSIPIPLDGFGAGLANKRIVTSNCSGGKERMRRLLNVVSSQRIKPDHLVTHRYSLDDVVEAYDLFGHQGDGIVKLALKPSPASSSRE